MILPEAMRKPTTPVRAVYELEQREATAHLTRSGVARIERSTTTRRRGLEDGPWKSTAAPAFRY